MFPSPESPGLISYPGDPGDGGPIWDALLTFLESAAWGRVSLSVKAACRQHGSLGMASDIEAEIVLRLAEQAHGGRFVKCWEGLAVVMGRNLVVDELRRARRLVSLDEAAHVDARATESASPPAAAEVALALSRVRRKSQREVLLLWFGGSSVQEIAVALNKSEEAVWKVLSRVARSNENRA